MFAARRRIVPLALLAALALVGAGAAQGEPAPPPPQITLLAPANGAIVQDRGGLTGAVEFRWRIDWPSPPAAGTIIVVHKLATDPAFTQNVSGNTQACPVQNPNCWGSFRPNQRYEGRYYWRVEVVGAAEATSPTWMFTAVKAQPPPDRRRPRVRAFPGTAKRGQTAFFSARVGDNRGEARMMAQLTYRNHLILHGVTGFAPVSWGARQTFYSRQRLSRRLPAGIYKVCITAWDRAGNRGKSCARYRVR